MPHSPIHANHGLYVSKTKAAGIRETNRARTKQARRDTDKSENKRNILKRLNVFEHIILPNEQCKAAKSSSLFARGYKQG